MNPESWWNSLTDEQKAFVKNWYRYWDFYFTIERAYGNPNKPTKWTEFNGWPK